MRATQPEEDADGYTSGQEGLGGGRDFAFDLVKMLMIVQVGRTVLGADWDFAFDLMKDAHDCTSGQDGFWGTLGLGF